MGFLHAGKERLENLSRKNRLQRSKQKMRSSRKLEKNKQVLKLTIPSRRGRRKK